MKARSLMDITRRTVFQECCVNHCRDWHETANGKPASNHAPSCEHYKLETFYSVKPRGERGPVCVVETMQDAYDAFTEDTDAYEISEVQMTRDQFEHMDEFEGF